MNALSINKHEIGIKVFNDQRVVTFKDIDLVHERPQGTASRNFKRNRKHLIQNEDYYLISRSDVGTNFVQTYGFSKKAPSGTILTETGYLMLVKSFTDDLAWGVQRELVNRYFRPKETSTNEYKDNHSLSVVKIEETRLLMELAGCIDDKHWQQHIYRTIAKNTLNFCESDVYQSKLLAFASIYLRLSEKQKNLYRNKILMILTDNAKAYQGALVFFRDLDDF